MLALENEVYDAWNRRIAQYDALRNLISYNTYDANRRITSVIEPEGRTTRYTYDLAGNRATKTVTFAGEEPVVTKYTYNSSNHLLSEYTGAREKTEYTYDANGNLIVKKTTVNTEQEVSGKAVTGSALEIPSAVVTGSVITVPSGGAVTGSVIRYTYDAFHRLTGYEAKGVFATVFV